MSDAAPVREAVTVEVRYAETDQMGVVHHANYLVWFELARTALCRRTGHAYADIERLGFFLMVSGAALSYRRGVHYGETVIVSAWLDRLGEGVIRDEIGFVPDELFVHARENLGG